MVFDRENSDFFASQANKVQQNSWLNVLSGMVSHKCLKANLTNARIANFRVGVCNCFHHFPFLTMHTCTHKQLVCVPFLALTSLKMKRAVEVASFVLYHLRLQQDSSLMFCPIALVFALLDSTRFYFLTLRAITDYAVKR